MLNNENSLLSIEERENLLGFITNKDYDNILGFLKERDHIDFTFTDENGNNILHHLTKNCNKDRDNGKVLPIAQLLLEYGVSHTAVNKKFQTPLDYAISDSNTPLISLYRGFPVYVN